MTLPELKPIPDSAPTAYTRWRHWKGQCEALVVNVGHHTETGELMVFYLERNSDNFFVRPLSMWMDEVRPGVQRFTPIPGGPITAEDMAVGDDLPFEDRGEDYRELVARINAWPKKMEQDEYLVEPAKVDRHEALTELIKRAEADPLAALGVGDPNVHSRDRVEGEELYSLEEQAAHAARRAAIKADIAAKLSERAARQAAEERCERWWYKQQELDEQQEAIDADRKRE